MNPAETVLATALRLQQAGTPYALVSVIKALAPASARPGDKAVVTADGQLHGWIGGGCAQPTVIKTVRLSLADGQARMIRITPTRADDAAASARDGGESDAAAAGNAATSPQRLDEVLEFGMACHSGGTLELFVDPVLPQAQLVVIGASPVAASLCQLAPRVGFAVTLVAHEAQAGAYPDASRVLTSDDAATVLPQIGAGAWVVVATQGRRDVQALRLALALSARSVSFVASARKAQVLKASLVAAGALPQAVAAIIAPAGYPMAATTPEEIALSVLAAVVSMRRGAILAPEIAEDAALPAPATAALAVPAAACCGTPMADLPTLPAAKASCCGGLVADLPPLPALKSSCCGGEAAAGEPLTPAGASARRTVQES
jgi:xanthine dehydrogenase accessory factor